MPCTQASKSFTSFHEQPGVWLSLGEQGPITVTVTSEDKGHHSKFPCFLPPLYMVYTFGQLGLPIQSVPPPRLLGIPTSMPR